MKKIQDKKRWRDFMQSKPVLILLAILLILFTWNVYGLFSKMQETAKNRKIEEKKIAGLMERKDKLLVDIASLKTDKGVEENIREKFGLVKDGEQMIVVVEDTKSVDSKKVDSSRGFFSFLRNIFLSR